MFKKNQKRQKIVYPCFCYAACTNLSWHPVPVCGACGCEQLLLLLSAARQLAGGGGCSAAVGAANRATRRATASLLVLSQFRYSADTCHRKQTKDFLYKDVQVRIKTTLPVHLQCENCANFLSDFRYAEMYGRLSYRNPWITSKQVFGSVKVWYRFGSGSASPMITNPDPTYFFNTVKSCNFVILL